MNELEWFYDFLKDHLKENGEFDKIKETYTLEYWKHSHSEEYFKFEKDSTEGFYFVNEGGTVYFDYSPERYKEHKLYLNPITEVKIRKSKFQDTKQEWDIEKYSLYNDLFHLYYNKFDTFYNDFLKFIGKDYSSDSYQIKISTAISLLSNYKKKASKSKFYIKKDGEDTLLLYFYLDELIKKIETSKLNFNPNKEKKEISSVLHSLPSKASKYGFYLYTAIESINIDNILLPIWGKLKTEELIEKRTKYSVFKAVFTYQKIKEKVVWFGDINQLYYFIKLIVKQPVYQHPRNRKKWEIAVNCFCLPNKLEIKVDQLQRTKEPKSEKNIVILEIVNLFINLKPF